MLCEQSARQCVWKKKRERVRGFGNLCVQATTEFWLFQHTCNLTRESYIGLVCVINVCVCAVHNAYIELYRCTYYHASDRIKILSAWRQIWNESHAIKFYIYSNILLCSNRKWDKYRFFSDFHVCGKYTPANVQTQQNNGKYWEKKREANEYMLRMSENNISPIFCVIELLFVDRMHHTHILPNKLIYLTLCRFVHVKTIAIHTRTHSHSPSRSLPVGSLRSALELVSWWNEWN